MFTVVSNIFTTPVQFPLAKGICKSEETDSATGRFYKTNLINQRRNSEEVQKCGIKIR